MIAPELKAAAEYIGRLQGQERELALKQLQLIVPANTEVAAPPVRTLAEYLALEFPEPPTIIEPAIVVRGELTFTAGRAGKGKTTMNLHRLLKWAAGLSMFPELPDVLVPKEGAPVRILVIENEGAAAFFQSKMQTMLTAEEYLPKESAVAAAENLLIWGDGGYAGWRVDDDAAYDQLRRAMNEHQPDVVFIEPFRTLFRGDENDSSVVSVVLDRFSLLATEFRAAMMVAHHERKSGSDSDPMDTLRGSTSIEGHLAVIEHFSPVAGADLRELSYSKNRYEPAPPAIRMSWNRNTKYYDYVPLEDELEPVLRFLKSLGGESATPQDVAVELDVNPDRARELLNKAASNGRVRRGKRIGGGGIPYTLTEDDHTGGLDF